MCGILLIAEGPASSPPGEVRPLESHAQDSDAPALPDFLEGLRRRGPDATGVHTIQAPNDVNLTLASSLLQLRGSHPAETPLINTETGDVLLWNGEIFGGIDVPLGTNDAQCLLDKLKNSTAETFTIPAVLSSICGPWAVVYWHSETQTLWFGRDVLGRRSLLIKKPTANDGRLVLTSSAPLESNIPFEGFEDLPPGIYKIDMSHNIRESCINNIITVEWENKEVEIIAKFERPVEYITAAAKSSLPNVVNNSSSIEGCLSEEIGIAAAGVLKAMRHAMEMRCQCIESPADTPLQQQKQQEQQPSTATLLSPPARILVLFSGGVDSTLLAALAHESLPQGEPIDLLSICFAEGTSPDRLSALDALEELKIFAPDRQWRLIGANKSLSDAEDFKNHLLRLLAPSDTVMDFNIGAALWLAADGQGQLISSGGSDEGAPAAAAEAIESNNNNIVYRSAARVVLLGHGADELFGGYGRHRTRFRVAEWQGLSDELALDVRRLWVRNLGRDDRLIADRSREARHPFLDEGVILEALKHPLHALADLRLPLGVGDKCVLRECLRQLGLPRAAVRHKRAIQFGTRLAKAANAAHFGGTQKANAKNAGSVRLGEVTNGF